MKDRIKIGNIGRILKGDNVGFFIKVQDDSENTGGYLILQSKSDDFTSGFDDWVENSRALEQFFKESKWEIDWQ